MGMAGMKLFIFGYCKIIISCFCMAAKNEFNPSKYEKRMNDKKFTDQKRLKNKKIV